jgi:futalosine hydrolase
VTGTRLLVVASVQAELAAIGRGMTAARTAGPGLNAPAAGPATMAAGSPASAAAYRSTAVILIEGGVGMAAAAAATMAALHRHADDPFSGVISAGIGGGIGVPVGGLALATLSIAADLGADSPDGFLSLDDLGLGSSTVECDADLVARLADRLPEAVRGAVLSVATVTGTTEGLSALQTRHPDAVAEAMEGFGVATAARLAGVPFAEVRSMSNVVGPRDRDAWRIPDALKALERVGAALATLGE